MINSISEIKELLEDIDKMIKGESIYCEHEEEHYFCDFGDTYEAIDDVLRLTIKLKESIVKKHVYELEKQLENKIAEEHFSRA